MSRQRFIHPSIWTSESFMALSRDAQLLFIGLFSTADDYGRGRGSPANIRATLWPGKAGITNELITGWVGEVIGQEMAKFYPDPKGRIFYALPTWNTWQKPKYRAASKCPEPNGMPEPGQGPARVRSELDPVVGCSVVGCREEGRGVVRSKPACAEGAADLEGPSRAGKDINRAEPNRRRVAKKKRCEAEGAWKQGRGIGSAGRGDPGAGGGEARQGRTGSPGRPAAATTGFVSTPELATHLRGQLEKRERRRAELSATPEELDRAKPASPPDGGSDAGPAEPTPEGTTGTARPIDTAT